MLYEEIDDPDATTPADLRREYESAVAAVVESAGVDRAAEASGVDRDRLERLAAGDSPTFTTEEAAAVLAVSTDWPDADAFLAELRDHLMLQMSSAVVDVDALAAALDGDDLDARTVQQKVEGRREMTLDEYARVHHHLAGENPY